MDKMPIKIKQKLRMIFNSYNKINSLQVEINEYFESKGIDMDDYDNMNKDEVLICLYNGGNESIEDLEESISKIEQIFLNNVNNK